MKHANFSVEAMQVLFSYPFSIKFDGAHGFTIKCRFLPEIAGTAGDWHDAMAQATRLLDKAMLSRLARCEGQPVASTVEKDEHIIYPSARVVRRVFFRMMGNIEATFARESSCSSVQHTPSAVPAEEVVGEMRMRLERRRGELQPRPRPSKA